ncbi:unnamed protein product [Lactuca saligna]|uniref:2-hydroxyacyl-CoA lyase n=1 Tax=Lactuca saligna TaxID=75948 RepID=A0AA36E055_LACSI|nr:unnamed protein product [Lactuca saligna]
MEPITCLDAGTRGKMGVGLGYYIAAAIASPDRLVVDVEGDFGFGFSAMELPGALVDSYSRDAGHRQLDYSSRYTGHLHFYSSSSSSIEPT